MGKKNQKNKKIKFVSFIVKIKEKYVFVYKLKKKI